MIHHIPQHIQSRLTNNDCKALDEDYEDYQVTGGSFTFEGWLKRYHYDIYIKLY